MKKMIVTILLLTAVASANSPIQIKTSDFWWKATKTSIEKWFKSIKISWNNEAALEWIEKGFYKVKEIQITPKVKETIKCQE